LAGPLRLSRRSFLQQSGLGAGILLASGVERACAIEKPDTLHLSTNAYSWHVFYQREGKNFGAVLAQGLAEIKQCGIDGYEPAAASAADVQNLAPLLREHGLEMRSLYVNSTLHTAAEAETSIHQILAIAKAAKAVGLRIIVTNPNPIQWGGTQAKNDLELRFQAGALNRLGRALQDEGVTLAYHNHDIELRQAAREFHHMMAGTDPALVSLCLDAHWIFRGSGDSQVALFDIVKLYGSRIAELHLRQSVGGVWSETLCAGDIDYEALAAALSRAGVNPHLVLEIAVEKGTPKTLTPLEAHRRSAEYARRVFAGVGA
jgi:inosose dehydratase